MIVLPTEVESNTSRMLNMFNARLQQAYGIEQLPQEVQAYIERRQYDPYEENTDGIDYS